MQIAVRVMRAHDEKEADHVCYTLGSVSDPSVQSALSPLYKLLMYPGATGRQEDVRKSQSYISVDAEP